MRLCLLGLVLGLPLGSGRAEEAADGFKPLFNGKDLTGWKPLGGSAQDWGVEDGVLFTRGQGGGWLMTEQEYSDFTLRLDYRLPKKGNSGVAIRAPMKGNPAYAGMEIQVLDDPNYTGLRPAQHTGSIYDVVAANHPQNQPIGEWNTMQIRAKGPMIRVEVNGKPVVNANLDDFKDQLKKHPGLGRPAGHLGVQSHGSRVEFRNIQIKVD